MPNKKKEYTENIVHAALTLGIYMVEEMAQKAITKNGNISLREFLKVLNQYKATTNK